jgi:hypothetical protein
MKKKPLVNQGYPDNSWPESWNWDNLIENKSWNLIYNQLNI